MEEDAIHTTSQIWIMEPHDDTRHAGQQHPYLHMNPRMQETLNQDTKKAHFTLIVTVTQEEKS